MICEQCHAPMIERPATRQVEDGGEEQVIVLECRQCGYTEDRPRIASFWRRLAA